MTVGRRDFATWRERNHLTPALPRRRRGDVVQPAGCSAVRLRVRTICEGKGRLAGSSRAERWWGASRKDPELFVEEIPFTETRLYVKRIVAQWWMYHTLYEGTPDGARRPTLAGAQAPRPG